MKRIFALLCALGLVMSFTACGAKTENNENLVPLEPVEATAEPTVEEIMLASETNAAALAEAVPPASATDTSLDQAAYDKAQELVGASVEELYEAIGEPTDSQYASSCLEENAEDGMLFYNGFYVWSLRGADGEIVHAVYLNG